MRIPILIACVLFVLGALLDYYIFADIRRNHKLKGSWEYKLYAVSAVVTMAALVIAVIWPRRSGETDILPIMWILYSWLTIYVAKMVYVLVSLFGKLLKIILHKEININTYVGIPAALLALGIMWWGALVTRADIEVTRVTVKSQHLPAAFEGFRIVQISDLHLGTWGNDTSFVTNLVDTINSLKPDVVLFTGDIVNRSTSEIRPFLHTLSRIKATDGVYSILGNHDYGDYIAWESDEAHQKNNRELLRLQDSIGWKMLDNTHAFIYRHNVNSEIVDSIAVIGVGNWGEPPFHHYAKMKEAYPNMNDQQYKILLSHNPKQWRAEIIDKTNIDLTLSGHTHAMQFVVKVGNKTWSPSKWRYPEWGGLYSDENNGTEQFLYVNIGAGEVGMPFRIGATPEVTVITLRR